MSMLRVLSTGLGDISIDKPTVTARNEAVSSTLKAIMPHLPAAISAKDQT